ncbi:response regulator transcription factor [Thermostaphylospora chromogena]|uniref:Response regulatory domain-containing protein n=1 Tax=Thermostaphylospora chromogena TaxID=35622 RepID=A0A1H1AZ32_9ACTN|nr:response regulator transcription factor [Thermostaphylospora chromogena]SDQ44934.1 hypothetical protein SAMN04489764_0720 [Thermostaphylospora chromogena]
MRVLIVHDDAEHAGMIAEALRQEGLIAHVAYGRDIEAPFTFTHDYDVIVLDRDTPALTAEAARRRLGSLRARILLIASAGDDDLPVAADARLTKPFTFSELVERVCALGAGGEHYKLVL